MLSGTRLERRAAATTTWPPAQAPRIRLYRNRRDGTFEDVDRRGRARPHRLGLERLRRRLRQRRAGSISSSPTTAATCCIATSAGTVRGRHRRKAGLAAAPRAGARAVRLLDYRSRRRPRSVRRQLSRVRPRDGAPSPGQGANCVWKGVPVNCGPKGLPTDTNLLYRNNGNGTFTRRVRSVGRRRRHRPLSDDRAGRRPRRRRLDRHLRRLRFDGGDPLSQQPRRHVHRRRAARAGPPTASRGIAAGRDGRRRSATSTATAALDMLKTHFADDIPGALPEPRPRPVRGRGRRRPVWTCRTATSSGARGCPISTTTAGWTCSTSPATSIPRSSACCRSIPHRGPRIVFRNAGGGRFVDVTASSGPGVTTPAFEPRRRRSATSTTTATSTCW